MPGGVSSQVRDSLVAIATYNDMVLFMNDTARKVFVFRHGATAWSMAGKHTGITNVPLTEEGRRQAARLRPLLSGVSFSCVMSSPLQRALETCRLAGLGGQAETCADLAEWNYGDYEGLTSDEIHRARADWLVFKDGCPNGEMPADVGRRVDRVIEKARGCQGDVALFAHGHVLCVLAARWLGLTPGDGRLFVLDTSTINILGYSHGVPALVTWNAPLDMQGL